MARRAWLAGWGGITAIGVVIVAAVLGLHLFERLGAAQALLDDVGQAFTVDRIAGDVAAVDMVSIATDTLDPTIPSGRVDVEYLHLIGHLAGQRHLSVADMTDRLGRFFPSTHTLLSSAPLSQVSAELPRVMDYMAKLMGQSRAQWSETMARELPMLDQITEFLPKMTDGWSDVPGTAGMTRFDGGPVKTMPEVRDYFRSDLIPVFGRQEMNFRALGEHGGVGFLASWLLTLGLAMIGLGAIMVLLTWFEPGGGPQRLAWLVVVLTGAFIAALIPVLQLGPRLDGGQKLLEATKPAFTNERLEGTAAGIDFVSTVVNALGPGLVQEGGASGEIAKLLVMLSNHTNRAPLEVKADLLVRFPHTTNLLLATPFSSVAAENETFYAYVAKTFDLPAEYGQLVVKKNFPEVHQVLSNLAKLTDGALEVPGTKNLTRFDGSEARALPVIRDYLRDDVVPALLRQTANYQIVRTTPPKLPVFPPLLLALGIAVMVYGLVFLLASAIRRRPPDGASQPN